VDLIAFTGSKDVGLSLIQDASRPTLGQVNVKRVIAEMGGKNAILVDDDADIDEALSGVLASAFGYQGQKCSACSRLVVVKSIYDKLLSRLIEATAALKTGDPVNPAMDLGPVIGYDAYQKIQRFIEQGKAEGRLVFQGKVESDHDGMFIPPTIFTDAPVDGVLAQEEIFGPVLTVFQANNFEEALGLANESRYALTGGVYSRSPSHIELAKKHFVCGNLYINRKITGAMVGRQPFGGFRLSGTGTKAGGVDTLLRFMTETTVTENTLRHGFPL
jgi:RHH-type proline utilization regulon transcriptional repressor/proline dehydrogenase/delta 1-pyrroline-5-carboxylate dehydrogenase